MELGLLRAASATLDIAARHAHKGRTSAEERMADTWQTIKEWPELILERLADAGVARIVLNRPDKRNCWNRALCNAFVAALDIIRADKELKVVITKGDGE